MTETTEVDWKTVTIASLLERLFLDNQIGQCEETAQSISSRAENSELNPIQKKLQEARKLQKSGKEGMFCNC